MSSSRNSAVIALIGLTGTGKTSFANLASDSELKVHTSLLSCTSEVQTTSPFLLDGKSVTLIDTPGLDDSTKSQAEVLTLIAEFLKSTFEIGTKLNGVLYFHRISDLRMGGIARTSFRLFRKLCGEETMKNVSIVTTMWSGVSREDGEARQNELATNELLYKLAVDDGARVVKHDGSLESAHNIIRRLLSTQSSTLDIQREMVENGKILVETRAGMDLKGVLEEKAADHRAELEKTRREIQVIMAERKVQHKKEVEELRSSVSELTDMLTKIMDQCNRLFEGYREYRESMRAMAQTMQQRDQEFQELRGVVQEQKTRIAELESRLEGAAAKPNDDNARRREATATARPTIVKQTGAEPWKARPTEDTHKAGDERQETRQYGRRGPELEETVRRADNTVQEQRPAPRLDHKAAAAVAVGLFVAVRKMFF